MNIPRGIRNNNPGNIRDTSVPWNGLLPGGRDGETTFEVFKASWWGLRALAILLRNYSRKYGLTTVREIINRWAPPSDNNPTSDYVRYVSRKIGRDADATLDMETYDDVRPLVEAIVEFENGEDPYSWEYEAGLILAGIEPGEEQI